MHIPTIHHVLYIALTSDPCVPLLFEETEEGKKVKRLGGQKFLAVFREKNDNELVLPAVYSLLEGEGGSGKEVVVIESNNDNSNSMKS